MSSSSAFDLGPANPRVSPLIKLSRWSLLVAGVFWGMKRFEMNQTKENEVRAYNARMQPVWDAENAAKKAKASREQLLQLAKDTGTPVPPGF